MGATGTMMIDESLSQVFCSETLDQLDRLLAILLELEQQPEGQAAVINEMFRIAHNIKGSSGMMGLDDLKELMHAMESRFDGVRKNEYVLEPAALGRIIDCIKDVTGYIQGEDWGDSANIARWKEEFKGGGTKVDSSAASSADSAQDAPQEELLLTLSDQENQEIRLWQDAGKDVYGIQAEFTADATMPGATALIFINDLSKYGKVYKSIPDPEGLKAGNFGILKVVLLVEGKMTFEMEQEISSYKGHDPMVITLRKWAVRPPIQVPKKAPVNERQSQPKETSIRVDFAKIDQLINNVQELLLLKSSLAGIYEQGNRGVSAWNQIGKGIQQLEHIVNQCQKDIMSLRMVPVRQLFARFPLILRDAAKKGGKQAEMFFFGEDTEIDKGMADQLVNPLTHMLRNAVDHGLESLEERAARGKPPVGRITLGAREAGNAVIISISDDGRGIDHEKVWAKAVKKGLVAPDQPMSKEAALRLIFHPGFSTAEQVTEISGRGVGMDVVQDSIRALKGDIEIETAIGQGTTFRLKVPLTLAIIQTFLVSAGGAIFCIPLDDVVGSLLVDPKEVREENGVYYHKVMGEEIPVADLNSLLELKSTKQAKKRPMLIVKNSLYTVGIWVDGLEGQEKVVLKQINPALDLPPLVMGAAFLGDGQMALVLNTQRIIQQTIEGSKEPKGGVFHEKAE
ncbi:MAG TPA: chemotaxis protein CheA [Firmicutes bacterium]|nr:chemotaxis protein CheA [Bacillota bacterium]HPT66433.1 chemotaxis protein CheA [Bacillota bacterium]